MGTVQRPIAVDVDNAVVTVAPDDVLNSWQTLTLLASGHCQIKKGTPSLLEELPCLNLALYV